jgi:tRNA (guanosine-2'-O-)-methyltransferase
MERKTMRDAELLEPMMSERRMQRLHDMAALRTRFVTVVLDDLYHQHNMSAVVRSAEAMGIQDIHVLQLENRFRPSHGVALGAQQWITVHRHQDIKACMTGLKEKKYLLLAADPPANTGESDGKRVYALDEIPLEQPVALVFGRERDGLHDEVRDLCDASFFIPMNGFTESLNVSVTAGIALYSLRRRIDAMERNRWELSVSEQLELIDEWSVKSVRRGEAVLKEVKGR